MLVDYTYYSTVYLGKEAEEASFPALCARAEDIIASLTHWAVTEETIDSLTPIQRTLVKKAICAQIDYFGVNGLDSVSTNNSKGFTVGKVSVHAGASTKTGKMADFVAPLCIMYLEQSGLMGARVAVGPDIPLIGGW